MAGKQADIKVGVITNYDDKGIKSAEKGLAGFRSSIADADGVGNKFKAGFASVKDSVVKNAGMLAVGAGAALVTFGVKAVGAFTNTAKAALDLSTATGLSTEQASRWIAVGDDFEVSATALQTGLGKIAKTLDDTKWSKYGIATRDAGGNARDTNDILLDSFDKLSAVTNETERARIGQELFGKGYQSLTPILGHTREEYEKMLGTVEGGQVITAKEAKQAEKMRLAQDQLGDAFKDVAISAGGLLSQLAPVITLFSKGINFVSKFTGGIVGLFTGVDRGTESFQKFFAEASKIPKSVQDIRAELSKMTQAADENSGFIDRLWSDDADTKFGLLTQSIKKLGEDSPASMKPLIESLEALVVAADSGDVAAQRLVDDYELTNEHLTELRDTYLTVTPAMAETTRETERLTGGMGDLRDSEAEATEAAAAYARQVETTSTAVQRDIDEMQAKWDALTGSLDREQAWLNLQQQARDVAQANIDAAAAIKEHGPTSVEAIEAIDNAKLKTIELKKSVIDYGKEIVGLPETRVTELLAMIDSGSVEGVLTDLDKAFLTHVFRVNARLDSITADGETHAAGRAGGATVTGVKPVRLATGGTVGGPVGAPVAATVHGGETVRTPEQEKALNGGGMTITGPINIYPQTMPSPNELVAILKKFESRNGPGWRS